MNVCSNCGKTSRAAFCSDYGSQMIAVPKKLGKAGPIFRLVLATLLAVSIMALFIWISTQLPQPPTVLEMLGVVGTGCLCSAWIMCIVRWFTVMVPPLVRGANAVCSTLIPLTLAALVVKIGLWLAIVTLPLQAFILAIGAVVEWVSKLIDDPNNVLAILLYVLIGIAALAVVIFPDICRLKGRTAMDVITGTFNRS